MDSSTQSGTGSLSIAGLLEFAEISRAAPTVLAGAEELARTIRWVHIADSEHVERFLEGGELVLTTATTFRRSPEAMAEFFDQLERAGAAGTIVELVDADSAPDAEAEAVVRQPPRAQSDRRRPRTAGQIRQNHRARPSASSGTADSQLEHAQGDP